MILKLIIERGMIMELCKTLGKIPVKCMERAWHSFSTVAWKAADGEIEVHLHIF